jgi:hypothetical protein
MWLVAVKYHHLEQATPKVFLSSSNPMGWTTRRSLSIKLLCSKLNISWDRLDCRVYFVTYTVGKHEEHHCSGKALQESAMINRWTEVSKCNLDQDHCAWHTWPGLPGGKASQQTPECQSERDSTQEGFGCPWIPPS